MPTESSRPDVAVFIDFENVYVSVRDKLDANPDFESIMDRCSELGRVVISRAYADWYRYPRVTSALYANGVEPMYVPTYYYDKDMGRTGRAIKNSADMNMCIDAMKTLFTNTNIAKFVLVTGDRDFIPLVNMIRQQGKDVIIIGIGGAASAHLAQSADEFIFYEQLIGKITPATTREANRQAERTRQAERARPSEVAPVEPPLPVEPPAAPVTPAPVVEAPAAPAAEPDPFETLVEAVHLARKRNYVSTLGSLKLVMKELMGGDFKESRYKDLGGRPFAKFKDFVLDAERRGKVQIFTNGTINEVFLPGEDPAKLSQFAGELVKEEPSVEAKAEVPAATNGRQPHRAPAKEKTPEKEREKEAAEPGTAAPAGRSRRRRRSRSRHPAQPGAEELEEVEASDEQLPDLSDELAATAMVDEFFNAEAGDVGTVEAETDLVDELLAPDSEAETDLVDALLIPDAMIDLPFEAGELPDLAEFEFEPQERQADEAELLAEAEAIDAMATTLVAAIEAEERALLVVPEPPTADEELPAEVEQPLAAAPEPAAEAPAASEEQPSEEQPADEPIPDEVIAFSDEEWVTFRQVMGGFTKPVAFAQIFDALRNLRQQGQLTRTNEQLRTLVKQAINSGMLERSGRGTRVYYRLPEETV